MSDDQQTQAAERPDPWAGFLDAQAEFYALPEQERIELVRAAFETDDEVPF